MASTELSDARDVAATVLVSGSGVSAATLADDGPIVVTVLAAVGRVASAVLIDCETVAVVGQSGAAFCAVAAGSRFGSIGHTYTTGEQALQMKFIRRRA